MARQPTLLSSRTVSAKGRYPPHSNSMQSSVDFALRLWRNRRHDYLPLGSLNTYFIPQMSTFHNNCYNSSPKKGLQPSSLSHLWAIPQLLFLPWFFLFASPSSCLTGLSHIPGIRSISQQRQRPRQGQPRGGEVTRVQISEEGRASWTRRAWSWSRTHPANPSGWKPNHRASTYASCPTVPWNGNSNCIN